MAVLHVNAQTTTRHTTWRRDLALSVVLAVAAILVVASVPLVFGAPRPQVHIRWREISVDERVALERRFGLTEATRLDDDEWSYVPTDTSPERLVAIVTEPAVADTDGINRRTFAISDTPPLTQRRGGLLDAPPWMPRVTMLLGSLLALLSALLFVRATVTSPALRVGSPIRRAIDPQFEASGHAVQAWSTRLLSMARKWEVPLPVVAVATGLLGATLAWRFMTFTGFTNDHYVHLALAQQTLLGDRPVRDFADSGWPLMYLLSAALWRLAGDALVVEWGIAAAGFALGAACTVVVGYRLSKSVAIAVLVAILEVLIYPRTYSYPKVLIYAVASAAIVALAAQPSRRRIAVMAGVIAVAFLFRHDHGLFVGVAAVACLAMVSGTKNWWTFVKRTVGLTAATGALLIPWIAFIAVNGGIIEYFEGGLEYARAEADATALAALPTLHLGSPLSTVANAEAWLFYLFWSLTALCGVVLCVRVASRRERWPGEAGALAGLVTLAALVNASFLRQSLQVRLPDAVVPAAMLAAWALGLCWSSRWNLRALQRVFQVATVIVLTISMAAISRMADVPGLFDETDIGRGLPRAGEHAREVFGLLRSRHRDNLAPPSRVSRALMPFMSYVDRCTLPSERLIVTGEFPEVLVIAGRRFAGDGMVFGSWYASVAHQDRTVKRLEASPPLFVVHAGDYEGFRGRFGQVDAFVSAAYQEVAEVPVEGTNSIRILAYRNRISSRMDPETHLGCYR
jgi:hypothetical protein